MAAELYTSRDALLSALSHPGMLIYFQHWLAVTAGLQIDLSLFSLLKSIDQASRRAHSTVLDSLCPANAETNQGCWLEFRSVQLKFCDVSHF